MDQPERRSAPVLAQLLAPMFNFFLGQIDGKLEQGEIHVITPLGSQRRLGGRGPGRSVTVTLTRWRALSRLAWGGSIGWYEGWRDGDWTCDDLVGLFELFMANRRSLMQLGRGKGWTLLQQKRAHASRANDRAGSLRNIVAHYDLGNDFYAQWLDPSMVYSSALFADVDDTREPLQVAQARKIAAILDQLNLQPGQRMLEIGCGWGALAVAGHRRGADVTAITLSPSQAEWAQIHNPGPDYQLVDYRDVQGKFDAVASVEMVEAVGESYWPEYLAAIARALKPGGRAAIQLISIDEAVFPMYSDSVDFIQAYVFPGGCLISEARFAALARDAGLTLGDRLGFGRHYAETLRRWRMAFDTAVAEGRLPPEFDDHFIGLWRYYLQYCEGGFLSGGIDVAQVTLTRQ